MKKLHKTEVYKIFGHLEKLIMENETINYLKYVLKLFENIYKVIGFVLVKYYKFYVQCMFL